MAFHEPARMQQLPPSSSQRGNGAVQKGGTVKNQDVHGKQKNNEKKNNYKSGDDRSTAMDSVRGNGEEGLQCDASTPLNSGTCCAKNTKRIIKGDQEMSWRWCRKDEKTLAPTKQTCVDCVFEWDEWDEKGCSCGKGERRRKVNVKQEPNECGKACPAKALTASCPRRVHRLV